MLVNLSFRRPGSDKTLMARIAEHQPDQCRVFVTIPLLDRTLNVDEEIASLESDLL